MIKLLLLAAALTQTQLTTDPGVDVCATVNASTAGTYSIRATASDSDGNESAYSNEVSKHLPGDVCWKNPTQNVDGSALTDLTQVTIYYELTEADPNEPVIISLSVDCTAAIACAAVQVVALQTGDELPLTWAPGVPPYRVDVAEWPDGNVITTAQINGESFAWTPSRAGAYSFTFTDSADTASALDQVFIIKLAAPTEGGID